MTGGPLESNFSGQRTTPRALGPFFWLAAHAPGVARVLRPVGVGLVSALSSGVRRGTRLNARRIFGRELSAREQGAFTRGVVDGFYEFVLDVGRSCGETREELVSRIESVEGEREYKAARTRGRGAVLVTAHMGSFEVGLGALARVEGRIHVVFKRDASGPFEAMRAAMRRTLGVLEAPIDDGPTTWIALRDALANNEVVVMQGDRAVPGQRSEVVPFLHGHLRIPSGSVRLARMTGSPIVPVFTVRVGSGRFAVHLGTPIEPGEGVAGAGADPAVRAIARAIEAMVGKYPTQWLALHAAFEEDAPRD